jgi:hypothetical protein
MIAKFKPTSRIAFIASAALLVVLGSVTFTRAKNGLPSDTQKDAADRNPAAFQDGIQAFQKEIQSQGDKIREKEMELNELQAQLGTPPDFLEKKNPFGTNFETVQMREYASLELKAGTQWGNERLLLDRLKMIPTTNVDAFNHTIETTAPDTMLATLLQNHNEAQTRLNALKKDLGENHPNVMRVQELIAKYDSQINDRVAGILEGMRTHAASLEVVMGNAAKMTEKIRETEASKLNIPEAWWPYFKARADLERLKKFRDILFLRLAQEKANAKSGYPDVSVTPR